MDDKDIRSNFENELNKYGLDNRQTVSAAIILDELLLLYAPDSDQASVKVEKTKKALYVRISIPGENRTPRFLEEETNTYLLDTAMNNTGFALEHTYEGGCNKLSLKLKSYFTLINNIQFAMTFAKEDKKDLIIAWIYNIIAIAANLLIPYSTGILVAAYTENNFERVIWSVSLLLAARYIYAFFIALAGIKYNKVTYITFGVLQARLLEKLFLIKDEKIESYGSTRYMQRVNYDASQIAGDITGVFNIVSNAIYYSGVLIASFLLSKVVFVLEIVSFVGLFYLESKRVEKMDANTRRLLQREAEHSELLHEIVEGACDIKLMGAHKHMIRKAEESARKSTDLKIHTAIDGRKWGTANSLYVHTGFFFIMLYLGYALHTAVITVPMALVLFNYFTIISSPMVGLIQQCMNLNKRFGMTCERIDELLYSNAFAKDVSGSVCPEQLKGDIEFKNVSFTYNVPGQSRNKVLNNISLNINAGTSNAFVGRSGVGKTTLLKLIAGQRDANIGTITIDGIDIMKINKDVLRRHLAVVSQQPFLFNTSIKENLLMAKPDATMEELEDVCRKACILDDINETEHGFDTLLNEKGVRFSGGQKQRLVIARALLKGASIIILDEATSAVDNITQQRIMETIRNLGKSCTVIIVAHRLSTIISCDQIFVMADGKIEDSGTHAELIEKCQSYRDLYVAES